MKHTFRNLLLAACALVPALAAAQYQREWAQSFDGGMSLSDRASDLVTDADGNIFVVGTVNSSSNDQFADVALYKFGPDGTQLWRKTFDGTANSQDNGFDLCLGGDGSINVVGRTLTQTASSDMLTIKYRASDGQLLWSRNFDGPDGSIDQAVDVVADADGNVYVVGEVWNSAEYWPNGDWCTVKYDVNGNLLWSRLFDGPASYLGFNDDPQHIALDENGDVVVAGNSPDEGNSTDMVVEKYGKGDGHLIWSNRYEPGGVVASMQIASNGDVVVAGNTFQGGYKVVIERITGSTGVTGWATVDEFPHHGQLVVPFSMVLDQNDNPVIGLSYDPDFDESNLNHNIQVTEYNFATGARAWSTSVGNSNRYDGQGAKSLAVDEDGNVMVVGENLAVPHLNFSAWLFDGSSGLLLWNDQYAFPKDSDKPRRLVIDAFGNPIALGETTNNNNGYADMYLIKYQKQRRPLGQQAFRGTNVAGDVFSLAASDDSYLSTQIGVTLSTAESPIQIIVNATAPTRNLRTMQVHVESRTSVSNIAQTIHLYNFTLSRWDLVDTRSSTVTEQLANVTVQNPTDYVDPITREVRAKISYKQTGPVVSYPWRSSIDQVYWVLAE